MDWTQTLIIIASIIGFGYFLNTIHQEDMRLVREDMRTMKEEIREDVRTMKEEIREDMKRQEDRWAALFEKFHILDKDMEKFRGKKSTV